MNVDQKELAIGIDLGTTYSCVAVFRDGKCEIIPDINSGKRTFPSYVAFTENGRLIGHQAKEQAELNAKNTIYDVKRLIGNHYQEVEADIKQWPFEVEEANQKIQISVTQTRKLNSALISLLCRLIIVVKMKRFPLKLFQLWFSGK